MREEKKETYKKLLTDELPVGCNLTGTGRSTNQLYGVFGTSGERFKSYDYSFQCHQFDDRISLYVICSGNKFSEYAKEKLVAEILFNNNPPEDMKCVLRNAFASLERDYSSWMDEYLSRHFEGSVELPEEDNRPVKGIHIAVALIYRNRLYTSNIGKCRIILCKTDNNNVLRAVQMSADYDHSLDNTNEIISFTNLEIVGPILLNETHRFLVLMSFGLCVTLEEEIYNHEQQNINREVIQTIVQQFRTESSLVEVAQTVIERIVSKYYTNYIAKRDATQMKRPADLTLMIRNFNFLMPNEASSNKEQATLNLVNLEHSLTNTTVASISQSNNIDTTKSNNTNSSNTTSSSEVFGKNIRINPYVDFVEYYNNVDFARCSGTLPTTIQFT